MQGLLDLVMKLMELIIRLTPYAVAALMFSLIARFGTDILGRLGLYAFCVCSRSRSTCSSCCRCGCATSAA